MKRVCCLSLVCALLVLGIFSSASADPFRRGDVDGDGALRFTDAIFTLTYLFDSGEAPACLAAADFDDSGGIAIDDAVSILLYLFAGGRPPMDPFAQCGEDRSGLSCERFSPCEDASSSTKFFGVEIEYDPIVFLVDRTPTFFQNGGFERVREEFPQLIRGLAEEGREVAIVFSGDEPPRWPRGPSVRALTPEDAEALIRWLSGVELGVSTCPIDGFTRAFPYFDSAERGFPGLVYVSDGVGTCRGARESDYLRRASVEVLDLAFMKGIPIQVFAHPRASRNPIHEEFLLGLADESGGEFDWMTLNE